MIGWLAVSERQGNGYMIEAVRGLVDVAFNSESAHRVVAKIIGGNDARQSLPVPISGWLLPLHHRVSTDVQLVGQILLGPSYVAEIVEHPGQGAPLHARTVGQEEVLTERHPQPFCDQKGTSGRIVEWVATRARQPNRLVRKGYGPN